MWALALASYGPDIIDTALMIPRPLAGMATWSHSLHLPLDLITARKPLIVTDVLTGLDLYHLSSVDFLLELVLIIWACSVYGKFFAHDVRTRRAVFQVATALILLQAFADIAFSETDPLPWAPTLSTSSVPHDSCTPAMHSSMEQAMDSAGVNGIVTLVCLTCGKEQFFTDDVPATVACSQCSGTVFRTFATPTEPDEAAIDAAEMQARSMAYGDSSPGTTADDVRDLDNL